MKLSHSKLILLSGLVWFAIGFYLLQLGLNLLIVGINADMSTKNFYPLIHLLRNYFGSVETAAIALLVAALLLGYLKGRYILSKTATKGVERILSYPNPAKLSQIYSAKYYMLIGFMIFLGISIKLVGLSNDIRGVIDAAIGSALINGSLVYFRQAYSAKTS